MKAFKILAAAAALLCLGGAKPAEAKIDVVATNQDLAWVAQTIGADQVRVDYLAASNQDPHRVDPRPSLVVRLTRADAVVRIGMDLDLWLDSLLRAAGNSKILINNPGYIDCSFGIRPLQVPQGKLDPSQGDIHIYGNPHYFFGPSNLPVIARNVRDGLSRVDPKNSSTYAANYNALVTRHNAALKDWRAKLAADRGKSVVTYHMSLIYFLNDFGLREFGYVEPRPGLTPTPGHVNQLAQNMKAQNVKVILTESYRPRRFSDLLAKQAGAQVVVIPGGIKGEKGLDDYFSYMGAIVDRVAAALK